MNTTSPVEYVKYPRTYHLPWSPGCTSDDKIQSDLAILESAEEVVVTLKMDGENTTIYSDGYSHARSLTASYHPSRDHIRELSNTVGYNLPETFRVCGENLKAVHSIKYDNLDSYFLMFSVWDQNMCLGWDETVEWAKLLDLHTVPVIYTGPMLSRTALDDLFKPYAASHEGYVVRTSYGFDIADFSTHVVKYVRPGHVQTNEHWSTQIMRTNNTKSVFDLSSLSERHQII